MTVSYSYGPKSRLLFTAIAGIQAKCIHNALPAFKDLTENLNLKGGREFYCYRNVLRQCVVRNETLIDLMVEEIKERG